MAAPQTNNPSRRRRTRPSLPSPPSTPSPPSSRPDMVGARNGKAAASKSRAGSSQHPASPAPVQAPVSGSAAGKAAGTKTPGLDSTESISTRQRRVQPTRSRRGGPGVGSCDSDAMILETMKRRCTSSLFPHLPILRLVLPRRSCAYRYPMGICAHVCARSRERAPHPRHDPLPADNQLGARLRRKPRSRTPPKLKRKRKLKLELKCCCFDVGGGSCICAAQYARLWPLL